MTCGEFLRSLPGISQSVIIELPECVPGLQI